MIITVDSLTKIYKNTPNLSLIKAQLYPLIMDITLMVTLGF